MSIKSNNNQNKLILVLKTRIVNFLFDNNTNINNHSKDNTFKSAKSLKSLKSKTIDKIKAKTDSIRKIRSTQSSNGENTEMSQDSSFILKNCELTSPITDSDNDIEISIPQLHETTNSDNCGETINGYHYYNSSGGEANNSNFVLVNISDLYYYAFDNIFDEDGEFEIL